MGLFEMASHLFVVLTLMTVSCADVTRVGKAKGQYIYLFLSHQGQGCPNILVLEHRQTVLESDNRAGYSFLGKTSPAKIKKKTVPERYENHSGPERS